MVRICCIAVLMSHGTAGRDGKSVSVFMMVRPLPRTGFNVKTLHFQEHTASIHVGLMTWSRVVFSRQVGTLRSGSI